MSLREKIFITLFKIYSQLDIVQNYIAYFNINDTDKMYNKINPLHLLSLGIFSYNIFTRNYLF